MCSKFVVFFFFFISWDMHLFLVYVPWALERNVPIFCCCLFIDANYILLHYGVIANFLSLLIFCLVLSIVERGMLRFPTIIVDLSNLPCSSTIFCFKNFSTLYLVHSHLRLLCLLGGLTLWSLYNVPSCSGNYFLWSLLYLILI